MDFLYKLPSTFPVGLNPNSTKMQQSKCYPKSTGMCADAILLHFLGTILIGKHIFQKNGLKFQDFAIFCGRFSSCIFWKPSKNFLPRLRRGIFPWKMQVAFFPPKPRCKKMQKNAKNCKNAKKCNFQWISFINCLLHFPWVRIQIPHKMQQSKCYPKSTGMCADAFLLHFWAQYGLGNIFFKKIWFAISRFCNFCTCFPSCIFWKPSKIFPPRLRHGIFPWKMQVAFFSEKPDAKMQKMQLRPEVENAKKNAKKCKLHPPLATTLFPISGILVYTY